MRRQRDERGAVALFAALVMVVLLGVGALAVDIGTQRVARADMQALADVVAMDLARQLDGRHASEVEAGLEAAKDRSVARNSDTIGQDVQVTAELGTIDDAGVFSAVSGDTVPDAVRVSTSASVPFHFVSGSGGVSRAAVAVARAQGCYKLGSWGARLGPSDPNGAANASLLSRVLAAHGVDASVSAATYQGLVGATVGAAPLAAALGLASPEALGTASVTLTALLDAAAQVVGTNGASSAQVAALNAVRAHVGSLGGHQIGLAPLFSVASGAGAGLTAGVDLADLVVGAILVADGNRAVDVDLGSAVPGTGSFVASIGLIQSARVACGFAGSTPNSSNQASVSSSTTNTLTPDQSVPIAGLVALVPELSAITVGSPAHHPVRLTVTTASASSTLDTISCNATTRSATVTTSGGLLSAELEVPVEVKVTLGMAPAAMTVTVPATIRARLDPSGSVGAVTISVPSQHYDTPYSNGGERAQLPAATVDPPVTGVEPLSASAVAGILDAVRTAVVTPMVTSLNASVVGPLSDLAGLRTSGADVLLLDRPSCTTPALRG
ncbi:pilus assembly protein TadG-related protein [Nocardioides aquiterrae]|uniref:Putative Flp pilus-assembly TadG-like N-terminal domain-containing protein n=1 Tax=Nocardioides aquiterrae TaxID=203799 RepID=A0ABN1UQX3_9ACTN